MKKLILLKLFKSYMERSRNLIWMIATICFLFSFSVYGNNIPKTNGIDVSGNLIDNDTWTLANSPYNIVGDVGVPAGLTLTIEAGVEINYTGDFRILVFGAIQVNGTETDSVRFNGNSVEGSKYMLEIRRTNLDDSHIDYAVMKGPQGSVSLGSFSDTSGNSGTMIINNCSISHGNILIKFDTDESSGTSSSIVFDGILLTGLTVKAYSNDWAESEILVWRNGIISNCEFQNVAALFEWVEVDNVTMLNFETLITLENSKISDSRLGIRTDENLTSLFALHVRNSVLLNSSVAAEELKYDSVAHFGSYSGEEVLIYKYCCAYFGGSDQISLVNSQIGHGDVGILMSNQGNEGDQIQNCTFYGLDRAITVSFYSNPTLVVRESNFLNSETSHFENYSSTSFNAQSNFWDSDSPTVIASKIYDQNDDLELGLVDYSNFLTTPNIDAPISPPRDVVKSADGAGGLDISWSANPESDLAAYQVHYGAFDGFSFENAVNVGNVTSYNLSGVSLSDSIAVTVLDSQADGVDDLVEGHESWFGFAIIGEGTANTQTDFTSFSLPQQTAPATVNTTDHTIGVSVSSGTDLTSLIPTFSLSLGATAKVAGVIQESGVTANDFSSSVTYTVTAEDGTTTRDWVVTVVEEASTEGLVAYYPFDGNANDESGNGNHATAEGVTLVADRFGNPNSAYYFSGAYWNERISGPDEGFPGGNLERTISMWVKLTGEGTVLGKDAVRYGSYPSAVVLLGLGPNGASVNVNNTTYDSPSTGNFLDSQWHMISFTYDGTKFRLYEDGIKVREEAMALNTVSNGEFSVANGDSGITYASVDDMRVYDFPLSDSEILELFDISTSASQESDFTSFSLAQQTSPATINATDHTINVTVESVADVTSLVATFSLSIGATAKVGSVIQESGVTANDFSSSVTYTVTAEDGTTTQDWVVTVVEEASTEGLVAYYPFDGNANDESGNGHHGTVNGAMLTTDRFENANSAYNFGGDDFIQIDPVVADLKSESVGSVNFWFRMTDVTPTSDMWLLNFGDPSSLTYLGVRVRPDGKIWLSARYEANIYYQVETSNVEITDAEWAMMTLVQDGSTPSIYINGIFVSQETTTGSDHSIWLDALSSVNNCRVGCRLNNGLGNTDFYEGVIDDLSLYNRALSESEILALFDSNGEINVSPSISPQAFSIPENSINGIEVGTVFATDPNGDDLTFTIDSGNTDNAFNINQLNGKITVFNQSALDYETRQSFQLSVSISDGEFSSSAIITINLTDVDETVNQAPQIVEETFVIEEDIANGTIATIQASDPDGQSVSFSITSSNPSGPFSVGTANGNVILTNSSQLDFENTDKYNLTVQVSDGELNTSGTIIVDLNNPTLFQTVTIPDAVSDMSEVEIEVTVTDLDGIPSAWLYKKKISQQDYSNARTVSIVNSTSTTKSLNSSLLESDFDNQGSEYYFRVIDNLGNFNSSPTYYTYQLSSSNEMEVTLSGLPGSGIKNYSIISFPFADPSVDDLLEELGPYNKKYWRLFRFNANNQSYSEYGGFDEVEPGLGYWFIQKSGIAINVGGRSVTLTDGSFKIDFSEGFNIIGNPFQGTLDWAATVQHNIDKGIISADDILPAYRTQLYKWNTAYVSSGSLNPFEGGFVSATTDISGFEFPVSALMDAGGRYASELPTPQSVNIDNSDWTINLFVKSPSYDYYLGGFGLNSNAQDELDDYDRFGLPQFSQYLDIVFENGEVRSVKERETFKTWIFSIPNNLDEQRLKFSWDIPISKDYTIVLVDGVSRKIHDLSEIGEIDLVNDPDVKHYLFFGTKAEIYEKLDIPFDVLVDVHPNPIKESISLKTFSNSDKNVRIELVSMDGRVVFKENLIADKGMNNFQLELGANSLNNGIYLLKLNDQFVTKLIKQ
ncbi:MAG: LamG-like jellyroll fold domain-containing protein [Cyclobacteriaceae bacterium]